jgi:gluconolactonase
VGSTFNREPACELLFDGYKGMEGPAFDAEGNLFTVATRQNHLIRWSPDGGNEISTDTPPGPNGSTFDPERRTLIVACRAGKQLVSVDIRDRAVSVFADRYDDGSPFLGPNDLRFHPNGSLYVTDPIVMSNYKPGEPGGIVMRITPDGSVKPVATEIDFPNGLCFSADWNTLYVADTWVQQILAYDVLADGSLGNKRLFAQMQTTLEGATQSGGPDGITMGADGNIYAAHIRNGSIDVISSGGEVLANLKTPHHDPSNLAFWGNDLYITDHGIGGVYRMSVGVSGLPLL